MEVEPEIRELMERIKSVPPFLGRHYFCKNGCEDFLKEVAEGVWSVKHWRLLKERDYVTYKYVVKPYLLTLENYGKLIGKLMEGEKAYLALIWKDVAYYTHSIFKYMVQSKESHRQCHLNGQATLKISKYGDVTVEYGYCRKEIPYTYRMAPGSQLRDYLREQYCPGTEGEELTCTIDADLVPEVVATAAAWPKVQEGELFKSALNVVQPILDTVVKSDKWAYLSFLWDAVDVAMQLLSVRYGLSKLTFEGILSTLEDLGLKAFFIYSMAAADMRFDCYTTTCYFGRGDDLKKISLECPIEKIGYIGAFNALYKEDPLYVYRYLRPYIEEELTKKL